MAESQRSITITTMLDETASDLSDIAKWPESVAALEKAKKSIKTLRKVFHDDGYPQVFLVLAMINIASQLHSHTLNRKAIGKPGLKQAWTMIGELLD